MPKNTAALTGPKMIEGGRKGIVDTGKQNNDANASPDTKSSMKRPLLTKQGTSR